MFLGTPRYHLPELPRLNSPSKDIPALKQLTEKATMQDIFDEVSSVFGNDFALDRNVMMYL